MLLWRLHFLAIGETVPPPLSLNVRPRKGLLAGALPLYVMEKPLLRTFEYVRSD